MNTVIFDFDGTIADSYEYILGFIAQQAGRDPASLTARDRQDLKSSSTPGIARKLGVPNWKLPLLYIRGRRFVGRHIHTLQVVPNIDALLAELSRQGCQMYIISSNGERNISRFLSEHGLGSYFRSIYGTAGLFGKAYHLRRLIKKHGLQANNCVYIGDEVLDMVAAQQAGTAAVAVTWGFSSKAQLLQQNPTIVVDTPQQLQKFLVDWAQTV